MKSLVEWQNFYDTLVNIRDNLDIEVLNFLFPRSLVRLIYAFRACFMGDF